MKEKIFVIIGFLGSAAASLFGGWNLALQTLLLCMAADWVTGGILLPAVFRKSPKSENGTLESRAGFKGLCRKGMILLVVLIAARLTCSWGAIIYGMVSVSALLPMNWSPLRRMQG